MADQTSGNVHRYHQGEFKAVLSDQEVIADTIIVENLAIELPHTFIGLKFYDAIGDPVVPSAGTVDITVQTYNNDEYEAIPDNTIDATAPTTVSVGANLRKIKATPTGLADATSWQVVVTQNRN